jgi:UDP-N-acetylglucosamine 4-epimerase
MKIAIAGTGDIRHSSADISKAKRMVGYTTTHDIYRGMQEAINWYIENIGSKEK